MKYYEERWRDIHCLSVASYKHCQPRGHEALHSSSLPGSRDHACLARVPQNEQAYSIRFVKASSSIVVVKTQLDWQSSEQM